MVLKPLQLFFEHNLLSNKQDILIDHREQMMEVEKVVLLTLMKAAVGVAASVVAVWSCWT